VVKAIERRCGNAVAIQADAADVEASRARVEKTVTTFGGWIAGEQCGTAIPKTVRGDDAGGDGSRGLNSTSGRTRATTQAALKHMRAVGRIIMIGSAVASVRCARLVPTRHEKEPSRCSLRPCQRAREPRNYGQQRQPGPIDTDLNPASGDWRCLRRPPQRSTAMGVPKRSLRWSRSLPVRSLRTLSGRILRGCGMNA